MNVNRMGIRLLVLAVLMNPAIGFCAVDSGAPSPAALLSGFSDLWVTTGTNIIAQTQEQANQINGRIYLGHVTDAGRDLLRKNDQLAVWINNHATPAEQIRALQSAREDAWDDASVTEYDGLGQELGRIYLAGRIHNELPLIARLLNITDGSSGSFLDTDDFGKDNIERAKVTYFYPRPFVLTDANAAPVAGDAQACAPRNINARDLASNRVGTPWAGPTGDLAIKRLAIQSDTSGTYGRPDIKLDAEYGDWDMCSEPSFPSGHTTDAYNVGITLATLLPEVAPWILARASESGNDRLVLGVHYPLDVIGGRIVSEAGIAYQWSDPTYREKVLLPARQELLNYIHEKTGKTVAQLVAGQQNYTNNPYSGQAMPGGTDQTVTDCASAVRVYTERLTYGLPSVAGKTSRYEVPKGAENLLLTAYPSLTDAQRRAVLAMTASTTAGPLDSSAEGWARLNLAAAMSATVTIGSNDKVTRVDTTACHASVRRQ